MNRVRDAFTTRCVHVGFGGTTPAYPSCVSPEPSVLAGRILTHQVRHLTVLLRNASDLIDSPSPDTAARADSKHIDAHPQRSDLLGLRWWAHKSAVLNLASAQEHVRGLKLVVTAQELLPLPAMTIGRAVYEAIINTLWLIDAEVSTEQRLARWAGRLLHDTQEPPNALDSFGDAEASELEKERVVEGRDLGQKLMRRAGFELKAKGGDRSGETRQVTYRSEASGLTPRVTELVAWFTPNQQSLWPLFSGAAHSRGWLVEGLEGDAATTAASVLAPLLDTSDALAIEVGRYFGLEARPVLRKTHMHRQALLRQARPRDAMVAGWEAYRAAGGAPPLSRP